VRNNLPKRKCGITADTSNFYLRIRPFLATVRFSI
jgi:hypothetical protein